MKTHRILLLTLALAPLAGCEEILATMNGEPAPGAVLRGWVCPTHGSTPDCPRGARVDDLATPADAPQD